MYVCILKWQVYVLCVGVCGGQRQMTHLKNAFHKIDANGQRELQMFRVVKFKKLCF